MKTIHYSALAVAAMLSLTACSSEDGLLSGNDGEVIFTVEIPTELQTKAEYSDGLTAENLHYYIYDEDKGQLIADMSKCTKLSGRTTTLPLHFVVGKKYSVVF